MIVIPFFSPIAKTELVERLTKNLVKSGAQIIQPEDYLTRNLKQKTETSLQHTYLFVGTGGTENLITEFLSKTRLQPPIRFLTYPGNNSLPAAIETRTFLQQNQIQAKITHHTLPKLRKVLQDWNRFATIQEKLQSSLIGLVGESSPWLVASHVDPKAVHDRWGITIKHYSLAKIIKDIPKEPTAQFQAYLRQLHKTATSVEVTEDELTQAALIAQSLIDLVKKEDLNALAMECFTLLQETNISGCLALSFLNDQPDLIAACEGDIPAAFTMFVAKLLTGQPSWMANVVDVDIEENSVVFAHCTCPTTILESYEFTDHFETRKSVAIRGKFSPQNITVMKIGGADLGSYWVATGDLVENLQSETSCRTQIRISLNKPVSYFLEDSFANHHIVVLGNHEKIVQNFFSFLT